MARAHVVGSEPELRELRSELSSNRPEVALEPVSETAGRLTFRMQHLLPFAVEVQYFPPTPRERS